MVTALGRLLSSVFVHSILPLMALLCKLELSDDVNIVLTEEYHA